MVQSTGKLKEDCDLTKELLELWLQSQMEERRALRMRLGQIEKVLVEFGRLSPDQTLPRRER